MLIERTGMPNTATGWKYQCKRTLFNGAEKKREQKINMLKKNIDIVTSTHQEITVLTNSTTQNKIRKQVTTASNQRA